MSRWTASLVHSWSVLKRHSKHTLHKITGTTSKIASYDMLWSEPISTRNTDTSRVPSQILLCYSWSHRHKLFSPFYIRSDFQNVIQATGLQYLGVSSFFIIRLRNCTLWSLTLQYPDILYLVIFRVHWKPSTILICHSKKWNYSCHPRSLSGMIDPYFFLINCSCVATSSAPYVFSFSKSL